jgi:hypothetical protein
MGISSPFRVDVRLGEGTARTATGTNSTTGMNYAGKENRVKLIRIRTAYPVDGYNVRLKFSDGTEKTVDLEPYLRGPIFLPLREDPHKFRKLRVDERMGTITWENGADIDPDVLYHGLKPAWMESDQSVSSSYKTDQDVHKVAEPKQGKSSKRE